MTVIQLANVLLKFKSSSVQFQLIENGFPLMAAQLSDEQTNHPISACNSGLPRTPFETNWLHFADFIILVESTCNFDFRIIKPVKCRQFS